MTIEKRIKRHILGKRQSFYVSVTPGLESVCADELVSLGIDRNGVSRTTGGLAFEGRLHECYTANLRLRTANRILMRIDGFKATNFRQLDAGVEKIPWELYLRPDQRFDVHVSSRKSRLFHTTATADHIRSQIGFCMGKMQVPPTPTEIRTDCRQRIFVYVSDDHVVLSMDSSGELLHKRGLKTHVGKAPLRETLAAAILLATGYQPDEPLLDPMCGSGTFSLEAAMIANRIPPGWYRNFSFMDWPCFKSSRWNHIRREAERERTRIDGAIIFASDKSPDACLALARTIEGQEIAGSLSVVNRDFFDLIPEDIVNTTSGRRTGLMVMNPPYGRRLETGEEPGRLFTEIGRKLKRDFKGWKVAILVPDRDLASRLPFHLTMRSLLHGGLTTSLLSGRIS